MWVKKKSKLIYNHVKNRLYPGIRDLGNTSFPYILLNLFTLRLFPTLAPVRGCSGKEEMGFLMTLLFYMTRIFYLFSAPSPPSHIQVLSRFSAVLCGNSPNCSILLPSLGVHHEILIFYFLTTWHHPNKNRTPLKQEYFWFPCISAKAKQKVSKADISRE